MNNKLDIYNREVLLKDSFNNFWCRIANSDVDLYSNLTDKDFIELKVAIKNINDILTYKTTIKFFDWIKEKFKIDLISYQETMDIILATKPNTNGFDIRNDKYKILAEIKCNLPLNNGNVFGRQQRYKMQQDIESLLYGKKKLTDLNNMEYYKFLGIYSIGNTTDLATRKFLQSKDMKELHEKVEILSNPKNESLQLSKDKVYIVYI
ncbi:hypothetical protein [Mesobacillus jeotgali]|uniref:Restriction endonuclease n=1 Tax=Mesobacillus jeotgali TaxID=129985 RepID=A0ABY9VBP4_9BACI|nr:hypothetical protein [Mesobacillus jeotgali]WNF21312.1 hypothetical protein RH061_14020 [Mesobacillus jeotgali]